MSHPQLGTAEATEILMPEFEPEIENITYDTTDSNRPLYHLTLQLPDYPFPTAVIGIRGEVYYTTTGIIPILNKDDGTLIRWDTIVSNHCIGDGYSRDAIFSELNSINSGSTQYSAYASRPLYFRADYPHGKQLAFDLRARKTGSWSYRYAYNQPYVAQASCRMDSIRLCFEMQSEAYELYFASMQAYVKLYPDKPDIGDIGVYFSNTMTNEENAPVYSNILNGYGIFIGRSTHMMTVDTLLIQ